MRTMMQLEVDVTAGSAAVKSGRLGEIIRTTLEKVRAECAYFTAVNGCRGGYIVFDLKDASDIPSICEPFFNELNAKIYLTPVMTPEDVATGIGRLSG
jgi:hypothetical protein